MTDAQKLAAAIAAIVASGLVASVVLIGGKDTLELDTDKATWGCVVPNCGLLPSGALNDGKTVDCLRSTHDIAGKSVTVWRGCNVMPAAESSGTQCLPAPCGLEVLGGEKAHAKAYREAAKDAGK